ncbi:hypothetical protein PSm6_51060 [Pseudomonas solani]|uniref:Uncharacterized protein n=1 Tax=Pseudomonas solani TaxID=2731552 RepID=A0ABM7LGJ5_9PSED|nr:hypothetical protein PSm6_51060 [Pseudomonas solani]
MRQLAADQAKLREIAQADHDPGRVAFQNGGITRGVLTELGKEGTQEQGAALDIHERDCGGDRR